MKILLMAIALSSTFSLKAGAESASQTNNEVNCKNMGLLEAMVKLSYYETKGGANFWVQGYRFWPDKFVKLEREDGYLTSDQISELAKYYEKVKGKSLYNFDIKICIEPTHNAK